MNQGINTTYQNLQDTMKEVLKRKFISINVDVKKFKKNKLANHKSEGTRKTTAKQSQDQEEKKKQSK